MNRLLVLLIAFAFAACESGSPSDDTAPPTQDTTAQSRSGEMETGASPGVSLQALLDRASARDDAGHLTVLDEMTEPARIEIDTQENRHQPGQMDTLRTRHYDGMSVTIYHVTEGKELLKRVTVTGEDYETDDGLHVGMSTRELENRLGAPTQRRDGTYVFEMEGPMPPIIHVDVDGDHVSRLQWNFPID